MTELPPGPWVEIDMTRHAIGPRLAIRRGVPVVHDGAEAWVSLLDGAWAAPAGALRGARVVSPDGRRAMRWAGGHAEVLDEGGVVATLGDVHPAGFLGEDEVALGKRACFTVRDLCAGRQWTSPWDPAEGCFHLKKEPSSTSSNLFRWLHRAEGGRMLSVADCEAVLWTHAPGPAGWELEEATVIFRLPPTPREGFPPVWLQGRPCDWLRFGAPPIVLGSSDGAAYALGHADRVIRMRPEGWETFEPDEAFTVWDRAHRLVRRSPGRLLAGWGDAAVGLSGGRVFRESLTTGERQAVGEAGRPVVDAAPIGDTGHVVLFGTEREWDKPQVLRFV